MDVRITRGPSGGDIPAIPSKSAAHRLLIAGALSGLDLTPYCDGLSRDITATKECLTALLGEGCKGNSSPEETPRRLPCGESGSTLRFLLPVAGVLGERCAFHCEGRLPERPMEPYLQVLAEHGCRVDGHNPKNLWGKLTGGEFILPGNVSSQYVTGLLFALPLAEEDSRILVEGQLQSRPYVDMTLRVLKQAGVRVEEGMTDAGTVFAVPGGQTYRLPESALAHIEGDWSNGAFWIVMDGLLQMKGVASRIRCTGLDPGSAQGDRAIAPLTEKIIHAGTDPVTIDVSDIPDLVPALALVACGRPEGSRTDITGAGRLRYKESDRLRSVSSVLNGLGGEVTELPEGLVIRSRGELTGGSADSFGDHRIVMMAAASACISCGPVEITGAEAVEKSYPGFFRDYRELGGTAEPL